MRHGAITQILQQLQIESEVSYLYGAQAFDNAQVDSDTEVLIIIQNNFQYFNMAQKTGDMAAYISLCYDPGSSIF